MCTFFLELVMEEYINIALLEAKKAFSLNEVPVGAIIVKDGIVIAKAHNLKRKTGNIMNHAELLAINKASKVLNDWRLNDCEMFVTLEPCPMCASAIEQSRIKKIYIGCESNIKSNKQIIKEILQNIDYNHKVEIVYLNNLECSKILSSFFEKKR